MDNTTPPRRRPSRPRPARTTSPAGRPAAPRSGSADVFRRRLGRHPGRGFDPPGRRQLLERLRLRAAPRSGTRRTSRRELVVSLLPPPRSPPPGTYTVRVRAVDGASNTESPSSRTFTIDPVAPQTTIDSSPSSPTGSTSADFGFSSSEGGSTFECRLDGGAWDACTSPEATRASPTEATPSTFGPLTAPATPTARPLLHLGRRHDGSELDDLLPRREWRVQRGWLDAGCGTAGLCGTYSDGSGSGVAQVQVSIRQGAGSYWDGRASRAGARSGTRPPSPAAAGRWPSRRQTSPRTAPTRCACAPSTRSATPRRPSSRSFTYDTTAPSALVSPSPCLRRAATRTRPGTPVAPRAASAARTPTPAPASSPSRSPSSASRRASTGTARPSRSGAETFLGASLTGGDWSLAFPASSFPADGAYTVRVRADDAVGNAGTPTSRTFGLDTTDPTGSLTAPADGSALRGTRSPSPPTRPTPAPASTRPSSSSDPQAEAPGRRSTPTPPPPTPSTGTPPHSATATTTSASSPPTTPATPPPPRRAPSPSTTPRRRGDPRRAARRDPERPGAHRRRRGCGLRRRVAFLSLLRGRSCSPSTLVGTSTTGPSYTVTWTSQPADGDVPRSRPRRDRAGTRSTRPCRRRDRQHGPDRIAHRPGGRRLRRRRNRRGLVRLGRRRLRRRLGRVPAAPGRRQHLDDHRHRHHRPLLGRLGHDPTRRRRLRPPRRHHRRRRQLHHLRHPHRQRRQHRADRHPGSPTGFVNGAAADPFTVTATTPDGDVASVEFFSCSNPSTAARAAPGTPWARTRARPTRPPGTIDPDGNRALRAVATDGTGKTGSDVVDVTIDRTNPTGSLTPPADAPS